MEGYDVFNSKVCSGDYVMFGGEIKHHARKYGTICGLPFTRRFVIVRSADYPECKKCFKTTIAGGSKK